MLYSSRKRSKPIILTSCASLLIILGGYCLPVSAEEKAKEQTFTEEAEKSQIKSPIEIQIESLIEKGDAYFKLGEQAKEQKDEKAADYFNKALDVYLTAYDEYGHDDVGFLDEKMSPALRKTKQFELGIEIFKKALEKYPDNVVLWNDLGLQYYLSRQYDLAESYFLKVLEIKPDNLDTCLNLGMLYYSKGDYNKSSSWINKASELDPDNATAKALIEKLNKK